MALGDPVRRARITPLFAVFEGDVSPAAGAEVWNAVPLTLVAFDPTADKGALGRSPRKLNWLMRHVTDGLSIGSERIEETIEVAFQHLFCLSSSGGPCEGGFANALRQILLRELGQVSEGYADPESGVGVSCLVLPDLIADDAKKSRLRVILGRGVFAPEIGDAPVGRLRYVPEGHGAGATVEPMLPDGRPAGLYQGQPALVVGLGTSRLPARLPLEEAHPGDLLFRPSSAPAGTGQPEGIFLALDRGARAGGSDPNLLVIGCSADAPILGPVFVDPAPGIDARWEVSFRDTPARGRFELIMDQAPSRLHRHRPDGPAATIAALRIPFALLADRDARVWVNVDEHDHLLFSSLQRPFRTVVWEQGELLIYHWPKGRFLPRGETAPFWASRDGEDLHIASGAAGGFGFLSRPPAGAPVFIAPGAVGSGLWRPSWLNRACRIERGDGSIGLGSAWSELAGGTITAPERIEPSTRLGPFELDPA